MHEVTAQDQDEAIDDYRRIANITKTFSNCCVSKIDLEVSRWTVR
jgi:hypothetical protein